jgi:hypothetical protein
MEASCSKTLIEISTQEDGRYHCPKSGCTKLGDNKHFNRLVDHCLKEHAITLLKKPKPKNESTLKKEKQIELRIAKRQKLLNPMAINNLSIKEWQESISIPFGEVKGSLKHMLDSYGVVVITKFRFE